MLCVKRNNYPSKETLLRTLENKYILELYSLHLLCEINKNEFCTYNKYN